MDDKVLSDAQRAREILCGMMTSIAAQDMGGLPCFCGTIPDRLVMFSGKDKEIFNNIVNQICILFDVKDIVKL